MTDTDDESTRVFMPCQKGCGHKVGLDIATLTEAAKRGITVNVVHERCPGEGGLRTYRVVVQLYRLAITPEEEQARGMTDDEGRWELLAAAGDKTEGTSVTDSLPQINRVLEQQWAQVVKMSDVLDQG